MFNNIFDYITKINNEKKNDEVIKNIIDSIKDKCNTEILNSEINEYVWKINKYDSLIEKQLKIEKLMCTEKKINKINKNNVVNIVEEYIIKSVL